MGNRFKLRFPIIFLHQGVFCLLSVFTGSVQNGFKGFGAAVRI